MHGRSRSDRFRAVIRLLVRTLVALLANAVGLIVAAALLDGMTLNASGFAVAVVVFTLAFALLQPFLVSQLRRGEGASKLLGGVALIATLVSLIVTTLITDGLSISGIGTWIAATVIVWLAAVLAAFILPFLGLKKYLEERSS
jgi:putative membrane protein